MTEFLFEILFLGIVLTLLGGIFSYTCIRYIRDPEYAANYVRKSPKLWGRQIDEKKEVQTLRTIISPLGLIIGIPSLLFGILVLIRVTLLGV